MAPRRPGKAKGAPKTASTKALQPKPARVTKRRATEAEKLALKESEKPAVGKRRQIVRRHRNGLVDLTRTPDEMMLIAERNARESPLLRLPGELRNRIWGLVMDKNYVPMPPYHKAPFTRCEGFGQSDKISLQALEAFRIPSVSRQIHAETALLAYEYHTFVLDRSILSKICSFKKPLLRAQYEAVVSVALQTQGLDQYLIHPSPQLSLRRLFPNLKRIEVDLSVCWIWPQGRICNRMYGETTQAWRDRILGRMREIEGEEIEIVIGGHG